MSSEATATGASVAPIWGELRYGGELARLLSSREFLAVRRRADAAPVLLIPGFMAGDASLAVMRGWLKRRGHRVQMSGILANVDCAERAVARLEAQVQALHRTHRQPLTVIGQSRGGALARSLAVRCPQAVSRLVMLGSPVAEPLAVSTSVLRTVRLLATLGDAGLPGVFSSTCKDGACCADFSAELGAPLPRGLAATAIYSRSDGIVDWRACLDRAATAVEVESSHCGMSVNLDVYKLLDQVLGG